ncbi:1798_t:CDS:2 [Ambispora leptoticha]|uniref:1798_t:CDS:1 n=1 Tax=Ambispora leptoticha TaxID=144679 RepID=A0A9N8Z389_9GLOM|nr:1798_t:CDS:2 [Ambispora leptoticha]
MSHSHFKSASESLIETRSINTTITAIPSSNHQAHKRTNSSSQTTTAGGGGLVNYLSNLKDRALKSNNHNEKATSQNTSSPRPSITVINTNSDGADANVLIVSPRTTRRKTWPTSRENNYQKRKGVLLSGEEERDSVINIYLEHRDHLEQDLPNDAQKLFPQVYFATENNSKSSFIMDATENKLSVAGTSVW